jgi:lipopolysaccharide transport system ATP-binding protein
LLLVENTLTENNDKNIAIKITDLKKKYQLGVIGYKTLQGELQSWWAKLLGKEDPNSKIGQQKRLEGESFMALNGVNMTIYKGDTIGIIGRNGAGKSTLLKLISRVTAPSEGMIELYGRVASLLEVGTGFHEELTGRENIYLNGAILGMKKSEINAQMQNIIDFSEVSDFIDTPVKRYSSGMQVKLAFAVAAHLDSEIMILDEVLAVGDVAFQKKCLDKMKETAQKTGKTVLYVSHNMSTIRQLCNRCIVLDEGKIIFDGETEEAIKIYLGQYANSPALVDLSGLLKLESNNSNLLIESVKLLNYKEWRIPSKSKIRFEVAIKAFKELDKICFCLHLTTLEGQIITILQSPSQFDFKENENKVIAYEADLSVLRPGQYCLSPELFVISEYGTRFPLNKVNMAITFEIQKSDNFIKEHELEYGKYGYVQFPEMVVL